MGHCPVGSRSSIFAQTAETVTSPQASYSSLPELPAAHSSISQLSQAQHAVLPLKSDWVVQLHERSPWHDTYLAVSVILPLLESILDVGKQQNVLIKINHGISRRSHAVPCGVIHMPLYCHAGNCHMARWHVICMTKSHVLVWCMVKGRQYSTVHYNVVT